MYNTKNYTEQGGDVTHIGGKLVIEEGATVEGLTSGLPAVTTEDNGDVLTVVEGAWAKADSPSGVPEVTSTDDGKILTASYSGGVASYNWAAISGDKVVIIKTDNTGKLSNDMTMGDICDMLQAGKYPIIYHRNMVYLVPAYHTGTTYRFTGISRQGSDTNAKPVYTEATLTEGSTAVLITTTSSTLATS